MSLALKTIFLSIGFVCPLGTGYGNSIARIRRLVKFHTNMNFKANYSSKPFTVCIEGNVGSGKTTFLSNFSDYNALILDEPVDLWRNVKGYNMLELLYKDPSRWGLAFQSIVQKTMLDLHLRETSKPIKMIERSIYSARYCFVENLYCSGVMSPPDFAVLDEWFQWIIKNMDTQPDLIVYLRTEPEVVHNRMKLRGRSEEAVIPLEYLQELHKLHDAWLFHQTSFPLTAPVIVVDANKELSHMEEEYARCKEAISMSLRTSIPTKSPTKLVV